MAFCEHCLKEVPEGEVLCAECAAAEETVAPPATQEATVSRSASGAPQFRPQFAPPPVSSAVTEEKRFQVPLTAAQLPPSLKPLGAWAFFGYSLLFMIPLVGFVLALVFACGGTSRLCLKNYARSVLLGWLFALVVGAGAAALLWYFGAALLPFVGGYIPW